MAIVLDDKAVFGLFNRLKSIDEDGARPALEAIGNAIKADIQMGFKRGVDPDGNKWAPLKVRKGQPLRDTRALMSGISFRVSGTSVEIGTNTPYAPYHQHGAIIKPKKPGGKLVFSVGGKTFFLNKAVLPKRQFIGYGKRQERRVANALRGYLKGLLDV